MGCGTGKTQTACALLNSVADADFVLWVAPLRTIDNLKAEITECDCKLPVVFYGVESIGMSDRIYLEVLNKVQAAKNVFIVVDESLKIKNLNARRTQRLIAIGKFCKYKLILNGTPITKNILDIYAQMLFLSPKILDKNFYKFRDDYCIYTRRYENGRPKDLLIKGYANVPHLLSLIEPYVYECSLDLPLKKSYQVKEWKMTEDERQKYDQLKTDLLASLEHETTIQILGILQKLHHSYCLAENKLTAIKNEITDKTIIY